MNKQQLKTLGQCRQWHLEQMRGTYVLAKMVNEKYARRVYLLHQRFAKAIEKCLPRPF